MYNQKGNTLLWVIIVILAVVGIVYFTTQKPAVETGSDDAAAERVEIPGETLKIGLIMPMTGDAAVYGENESRAATIAADEINAAGGVGGKTIELIIEDGKCDGEGGAAAANKLIGVDGVDYIIGGACSGETLGFVPIAAENAVLSISPSATSPAITTAGDFVFRTAPSDALAGQIAAEYAYEDLGAMTAAVVYETTDYAQALANTFKTNFEAAGGTVALFEGFNTGDTDVTAQVLKIQAQNPAVIYVVPQTPSSGALVLKQLKATSASGKIVTSEVMASDTILNDYKDEMEGVTAIEPFFDQGADEASAFLESYRTAHGAPPEFPFFAASAYADVYLIAEAIEAVGYDTKATARYLSGLTDWTGALGTISFDQFGDVVTSYLIKTATGGTFPSGTIVAP